MKKIIDDLRNKVSMHDKLYDEGAPIITDTEYDELYLKLVTLESEHPEFYDKNSPTQKIIISDTVTKQLKLKHKHPMLSQQKIRTKEEILKFINKMNTDILVQKKLDGLTIVLTYENHKLVAAVTRGNGEVGNDILHVVKNIDNIPKTISFAGPLTLRGEIIMNEVDFIELNKSGEYSSSRNLVSGTCNTLDGKLAKERNIYAIIYDLVDTEDVFTTDTEMLEFISNLGFDTISYELFSVNDYNKLVDYVLSFNSNERHKLPYKIDGLVLKTNDLALRGVLGSTSKYPKWGAAFKFESLDATTKLTGIEWTVGKSGQVTPKALFDTVEIDGVSIKQATLSNIGNIKDKDIRLGDTILVARSNDVIPYVVKSLKELRNGSEKEIHHPTTCPICNSQLEIKYSDTSKSEFSYYYCRNTECNGTIVRKPMQFVSRSALNIDGLGEKTIETLYNKGIVSNIEDIYILNTKIDELLSLEKFGQKKVDKLLQGVSDSKNISLSKFLYGLTIDNLGQSNSKLLANKYVSMENLLLESKSEGFYDDLLEIDTFGDIIANSLVEYFSNENNITTIKNLLNLGFSLTEEAIQVKDSTNKINGKIFVITGTLSKPRNDFKALIESFGGKVSGSVSKKTDYLLLGEGEENSSKKKKADEIGTIILNEESFNNLLK